MSYVSPGNCFLQNPHLLKLNWIENSIGRLWACHKPLKCLHQQAAYHCSAVLSSTKHFPHAKMSNQIAIYWTLGYTAYLLLRTDNNKHKIITLHSKCKRRICVEDGKKTDNE